MENPDGRSWYLMKMAWGLTVSAADIEDAVQEARIAIWRRPDADWRFVARNRMIDCVRKWYGRKAQVSVPGSRDYRGMKRNHASLEGVQVVGPDLLGRVEDRIVLDGLVGRADLSDRELFVLEGFSRGVRGTELALVLGVSGSHVSWLRRRAVDKLRGVA